MVGIEYAKTTQQKCILLQLDLNEAYGGNGWSFIARLMKSLGFGQKMSLIAMRFVKF